MAGSQVRSNKLFNGTSAERAALDTTKLRPSDRFLESDTGSELEWSGSSWATISTGGAAHTETQAGSVWSYGGWPQTQHLPIDSTAPDTSAGSAILTRKDARGYGRLTFKIVTAPTTGFRIQVAHDEASTWETLTTDSLAAYNSTTGAIVTAATLATTTAGSFYVDFKAYGIRIIQIGSGTAGKVRGSLGNM